METDARRRLIEKALMILGESSTLVAVSVDDFFDGNSDEQSIGVNLPRDQHIGLIGFRRVLMDIQSRSDVQAVLIELTEIPDPDDELDEGIWPTACVVFVVTSAPLSEVNKWVAAIHPRDLREGWCVGPETKTPIRDSDLYKGMRPVRVWLL